jgi:hypothetical protein
MEINLVHKEVVKKVHYIVLNGVEHELGEFYGTLCQLEDADGSFEVVIIYDSKLASALVKCGAAIKTTRGSYKRGDKWQEVKQSIESKLEPESRTQNDN